MMPTNRLLAVGMMGTVIAAVCCLTPGLVILLGALGCLHSSVCSMSFCFRLWQFSQQSRSMRYGNDTTLGRTEFDDHLPALRSPSNRDHAD